MKLWQCDKCKTANPVEIERCHNCKSEKWSESERQAKIQKRITKKMEQYR